METTQWIIGGLTGAVATFAGWIKNDTDKKMKALDESKVEKDVCAVTHKAVAENFKDLKKATTTLSGEMKEQNKEIMKSLGGIREEMAKINGKRD
jgi:molybdopterin synthase catalytic subunit